VHNRQRDGGVNGTQGEIFGWAQQNPAAPGELTVNLQGPPFPAPYWIILLGPQEGELDL
jgi:hypothetical protein